MFQTTLKGALLCAALALPSVPAAQAAAVDLRLDAQPRHSETLRLETGAHTLAHAPERAVLGARRPSLRTHFTLLPSEFVESLELRLHGDPSGTGAAPPIELRLNNGKPVRLDLMSDGFTADVAFSIQDIRSGRNTLDIALVDPDGCASGAWDLDLARSTLRAVSRPRSRAVFLGEIDAALAQATLTPRRIALDSHGRQALTLEALAAQGVALRTPTAPEFTAAQGNADLRVLLGTRADLGGLISDPMIRDSRGPRVAVHDGRPLRLVITGDTDAEVRAAADAFATHRLPASNRRSTGPGEMALMPGLVPELPTPDGRTALAAFGNPDSAAEGIGALRFRVADPDGSRATLSLSTAGGAARVLLNGRSLASVSGEAEIEVPQGWLQGRNTLEFHSDDTACGAPAFRLSESHLTLQSLRPSPSSDLSRVAASGGRYTDGRGDGTHVLLSTSRRARFRQYRVLAELARNSGGGLTAATYGTGDRPDADLLALAPLPASVDVPRAVSNAGRAAVASFPSEGRWVASLGGVAPDRVLRAWSDLSGGVSRVADGDADRVQAERVQVAWSDPEPTADATGPALRLREFGLREFDLREFDLREFHFPEVDLAKWASAPELGEGVGRIVRTVRTETLGSLATLQEGWSEVDWRVLDRVRTLRPRGRYGAPVAVPAQPASDPYGDRNAFRDLEPNEFAAAGFRQWERGLDRKADAARRATGIGKVDRIAWSWADRNLSLPALLMMLAFGLSTWLLVRSDTAALRR